MLTIYYLDIQHHHHYHSYMHFCKVVKKMLFTFKIFSCCFSIDEILFDMMMLCVLCKLALNSKNIYDAGCRISLMDIFLIKNFCRKIRNFQRNVIILFTIKFFSISVFYLRLLFVYFNACFELIISFLLITLDLNTGCQR